MARGKALSPETISEVLAMHNEGLVPKDIADELPISLGTVYLLLRDHSLIPNRRGVLDSVDVDAMLEDYFKGLPLRILCQKYAMKTGWVYQALNARGLSPRGGRS